MKRFIAALLFAAVYAQDEETTVECEEGDEECESSTVDETWDAISSWASAETEPVEFESIMVGAPCTLGGAYGWWKVTGIGYIFIREEVGGNAGCDIADGAKLLTWSAIEKDDEPGMQEGFYCSASYVQGDAAAALLSLDVETQQGELDYDAWKDTVRTDWCKDSETCSRQTKSQWMVIGTDLQENYPASYDDNISFASCSAYRTVGSITGWEMKTGTAYEVDTGYMIYDTEADYDAGLPSATGAGTTVTMTFEAAAALVAGAALTASTLAF